MKIKSSRRWSRALLLASSLAIVSCFEDADEFSSPKNKPGIVGHGELSYYWSRTDYTTTGTAVQRREGKNLAFEIMRDAQGFYTLAGGGLVGWRLIENGDNCSFEAAAAGVMTLSGVFLDLHQATTSGPYLGCSLVFGVKIEWQRPDYVYVKCPGSVGAIPPFPTDMENIDKAIPLETGITWKDSFGATYTLSSLSIDPDTDCSVSVH